MLLGGCAFCDGTAAEVDGTMARAAIAASVAVDMPA